MDVDVIMYVIIIFMQMYLWMCCMHIYAFMYLYRYVFIYACIYICIERLCPGIFTLDSVLQTMLSIRFNIELYVTSSKTTYKKKANNKLVLYSIVLEVVNTENEFS